MSNGIRLRVAFDIDDVLWDLSSCWLNEYNSIGIEDKKLLKEQVDSWNIVDTLKPKDVNLFWGILSTNQLWDSIDNYVYENTKNLLQILQQEPMIELYIVTATHPNNLVYKLPAFFKCFPFIDWKQLVICQDKSMLNMDLWVDDKPELMEKLSRLGKNCCMLKKPWNMYCHEADWEFDEDFGLEEWRQMCDNVDWRKQDV